MAERLPDRAALGLQLFAGIAEGIPSVGKLAVAVPDLLEPRFAVGDQAAADRPRDGDPFVADGRHRLCDIVISALCFAELLGHIADIGQTFGVELRPVVERHKDVWPRAGLDRRGYAGLNVVGVDRLDIELDAEGLIAFRGDLGAQHLIGSRHKIGPPQPMHRGRLRIGRRPPRGQDPGDPDGARRDRAGAGKFQ